MDMKTFILYFRGPQHACERLSLQAEVHSIPISQPRKRSWSEACFPTDSQFSPVATVRHPQFACSDACSPPLPPQMQPPPVARRSKYSYIEKPACGSLRQPEKAHRGYPTRKSALNYGQSTLEARKQNANASNDPSHMYYQNQWNWDSTIRQPVYEYTQQQAAYMFDSYPEQNTDIAITPTYEEQAVADILNIEQIELQYEKLQTKYQLSGASESLDDAQSQLNFSGTAQQVHFTYHMCMPAQITIPYIPVNAQPDHHNCSSAEEEPDREPKQHQPDNQNYTRIAPNPLEFVQRYQPKENLPPPAYDIPSSNCTGQRQCSPANEWETLGSAALQNGQISHEYHMESSSTEPTLVEDRSGMPFMTPVRNPYVPINPGISQPKPKLCDQNYQFKETPTPLSYVPSDVTSRTFSVQCDVGPPIDQATQETVGLKIDQISNQYEALPSSTESSLLEEGCSIPLNTPARSPYVPNNHQICRHKPMEYEHRYQSDESLPVPREMTSPNYTDQRDCDPAIVQTTRVTDGMQNDQFSNQCPIKTTSDETALNEEQSSMPLNTVVRSRRVPIKKGILLACQPEITQAQQAHTYGFSPLKVNTNTGDTTQEASCTAMPNTQGVSMENQPGRSSNMNATSEEDPIPATRCSETKNEKIDGIFDSSLEQYNQLGSVGNNFLWQENYLSTMEGHINGHPDYMTCVQCNPHHAYKPEYFDFELHERTMRYPQINSWLNHHTTSPETYQDPYPHIQSVYMESFENGEAMDAPTTVLQHQLEPQYQTNAHHANGHTYCYASDDIY